MADGTGGLAGMQPAVAVYQSTSLNISGTAGVPLGSDGVPFGSVDMPLVSACAPVVPAGLPLVSAGVPLASAGVPLAPAGVPLVSAGAPLVSPCTDAYKAVHMALGDLVQALGASLGNTLLMRPNVRISSTGSGTGHAEESSQLIEAALGVHSGIGGGFTCKAVSTCDTNKQSRRVLAQRYTSSETHLFVDFINWLPAAVRSEVHEAERTIAEP